MGSEGLGRRREHLGARRRSQSVDGRMTFKGFGRSLGGTAEADE